MFQSNLGCSSGRGAVTAKKGVLADTCGQQQWPGTDCTPSHEAPGPWCICYHTCPWQAATARSYELAQFKQMRRVPALPLGQGQGMPGSMAESVPIYSQGTIRGTLGPVLGGSFSVGVPGLGHPCPPCTPAAPPLLASPCVCISPHTWGEAGCPPPWVSSFSPGSWRAPSP